MRINSAFASLIDARLTGLVHDSVAGDPAERSRHERFLISRLATGAVLMAMLPPYLLWRGVPTLVEANRRPASHRCSDRTNSRRIQFADAWQSPSC